MSSCGVLLMLLAMACFPFVVVLMLGLVALVRARTADLPVIVEKLAEWLRAVAPRRSEPPASHATREPFRSGGVPGAPVLGQESGTPNVLPPPMP